MRWFRGMAMVLVGIMLLTISGSAFAAVKDDTVSPLYLYAAMRLNTDETVSTVKVSGVFTPDSK